MNIAIIANFTGDYSDSDNGRFLYLAKMLCEDNDVELITSSFRHEEKKQRSQTEFSWPFKITFIYEPGYPKNVCIKRFYSHFGWGINLLQYIKNRTTKPDVIYCAVPSLTGPNLIGKYCEKENIRFVIDVQDLWPEAYQMVFNVPLISRIIYAPFNFLADNIYKRADAICAVSDTYCQRAARVNLKVKETTTVFLGTELETFDRYAAEKPLLEKHSNEFWIAYCGTLGSSYDLTCVIDAIALLNDDGIRFIVMGDGPMMTAFSNYANEKKINAEFVGRLSYRAMCSLLNSCDIAVNPISHLAAQSIINKHSDYVASGLPIVSTQENDEFKELIETFQMGFNCRNNDCYDLAEKIKILMNDESLRTNMGLNARLCAEERFDRKYTYHKLINQISSNKGKD